MKYHLLIFSTILLIACKETVPQTTPITTTSPVTTVSPEPFFDEGEYTYTKDCTYDLFKACMKNDSASVKKIIADGCEVNARDAHARKNPLYASIMHDDLHIMKLLLQAGADPNLETGNYGTVIRNAIRFRKTEAFKLLAQYGADLHHINKKSKLPTLPLAAISAGDMEGLKFLLDAGVAIETDLPNSKDPIHLAISRGRVKIAEELLRRGASPSVPVTESYGDCVTCPIGILPMHRLTYLNDPEKIKQSIDLLLYYEADINAGNERGITPLTYMATKGKAEIADYLISKGAKISEATVVLAASYQNDAFLEVLLQQGEIDGAENITTIYSKAIEAAIFCCGDGFNDRPLEERIKTLELLLSYGARPSGNLVKRVRERDQSGSMDTVFGRYGY